LILFSTPRDEKRGEVDDVVIFIGSRELYRLWELAGDHHGAGVCIWECSVHVLGWCASWWSTL